MIPLAASSPSARTAREGRAGARDAPARASIMTLVPSSRSKKVCGDVLRAAASRAGRRSASTLVIDEYASTPGDSPAARHSPPARDAPSPMAELSTSVACRCASAGKSSSPIGTRCCCRLCRARRSLTIIPSRSPAGSRSIGGEQRPYWDLTTWMAPAGACYLPATVIPVGRLKNGLPVGIQIVGPYLEDRTTLDLAKRLAVWSADVRAPPASKSR